MSDWLAKHPLWQTPACDSKDLLSRFQQTLEEATQQLYEDFEQGELTETLILRRANLLDALLSQSLLFFIPDATLNLSLVAVGGYGRRELLPYSDIDLLILCDEQALATHKEPLEQFITFLWDTKLKIGHSVRTLDDCIQQAIADITVLTNLMESRLICGTTSLYSELMGAIGPEKIWPSKDFFSAKREEQIARHKRYSQSEYRLEPNIKSSPGGLRDIQMVGWIAKRHFDVPNIDALVEHGFLTREEYAILVNGQSFLFKIRFALHMLNKREEDRLLFEQQIKIARFFGFEDNVTLAVEQLMKQYYRWAQRLNQLNDLIMQLFDENIVRACEAEELIELNPRFRMRNQQIETANDRTFSQTPYALLEIFVLMAKHTNIVGARAATIRQLREHLHLIDDNFRKDAKNRQLFVELLRSPDLVATQLNLMNRYGILGKYIPAFGDIVGQTQHDLFHVYTVDAHTLQVLKNARRLTYDDPAYDFPIVGEAMRHIGKRDLLYLACLFHDIGKGRGGDHSTLGAIDALEFCLQHGYSRRDSNLVSWLVRQHLLMSYTAQKKDLSDPDVIREFALAVGDVQRLNYLFVLTVADINGTNPKLWNSWRASLLRNLYVETKLALRRGLENVIDKQELIEEKQQLALSALADIGTDAAWVDLIWSNAGDDYFLRESVNDIVWQTRAIFQNLDSSEPLVLIHQSPNLIFNGATQIFIHTKDTSHIFATVVAALEQKQLNIVDARIYSSTSGYTLDTFMVLNENGEVINDSKRLLDIQQTLEHYLKKPEEILNNASCRLTSRRLRHFNIPTRTRITHDEQKGCSILEVIAADRPGLLATIGRIFVEFEIELINAKIATLGERVEDIFFITDKQQKPLWDEALCHDIQQAIRQRLDEKLAQENKNPTAT